MSEHAWSQENLESFVAGGLEPGERERLEQHLAGCPECVQRLAEIGAVDRQLDWLFTQVRPPADMEDRMIQSLRNTSARRGLRVPLFMKVATAAAAVIMFGLFGAALTGMMVEERWIFGDSMEAPLETLFGMQKIYDKTVPAWRANDDYPQYKLLRDPGTMFEPTDSVVNVRGSSAYSGDLESLKNKPLKRGIKKGEVLTLDDVMFKGGSLDAQLPPGRIAKAVRISPETSVAGFVVPGTHVDVYADSKLIMEDVRVRSVDLASERPEERAGSPGATATLELAPEQAARLAQSNGRIELLLRSKDDWGKKSKADDGRTVTADDLAEQMRERSLSRLGDNEATRVKEDKRSGATEHWGRSSRSGKEAGRNLQNEDVGHDPKAPLSYNVDRVDDVSVPGKLQAGEKVGITNGSAGAPMKAPPPPSVYSPPVSGGGVATPDPYAYYSYRGHSSATSATPVAPATSPASPAQTPPPPPPPPPPSVTGGLAAGRYFKPTAGLGVQPSDVESAPAPKPGKPEPKTEAPKEKDSKNGDDKKPEDKLADKSGKAAPAAGPVQQRRIIRSGDMEFEVDGFDAAVDKVTKIANEEQGYVGTVNSEKLPNGKVRGSIVVRVPPDRLDTLILKLRALGELKSQKIGSLDITKEYTDLESRLRAARTMEDRLLNIIKTGKGEIKDLLQAEKELGDWRTRIETLEGEIRYYNNLVSLSTLTITLIEKEIRSAFGLTETERVSMGLEVEDVEKAQREALTAIAEAKGRVTKSELKQFEANQLRAVIQFEVTPESAGPLRDRLKQLGAMARLDIDRAQKSEGGTGRPQDAKVKRNDTQFDLSLYNLANVAPRKTVHLDIACVDAEAAYKAILDRVKPPGRIVTSNLDRQRSDQTVGTVTFEVREAEADAVLAETKEAGEVMRMQVTENPDVQNVTKSKRGFVVKLVALGAVQPRETADIKLLARNVPDGFKLLKDTVAKAKGRILNARLDEQDCRNITARIELDVRRTEEAGLNAALATTGDIYSRTVSRAQDAENVVDSKVRINIDLLSVIPPRETVTLGMEVTDVDKIAEVIAGLVSESKGKTEESNINHERDGRVTGSLIFSVPLSTAPGLLEKFRGMGVVRSQANTRNPQVPESDLASARLVVVLSNAPLIVPRDDSLWRSIREGLNFSFRAFSISLMFVIIGVLFVLPWAVVIYLVYRVWLRLRPRPTTS